MIERDLQGWTIAFDLDGTLVETAPDLVGTLNRLLALPGVWPCTPALAAVVVPLMKWSSKFNVWKAGKPDDWVLTAADLPSLLQ